MSGRLKRFLLRYYPPGISLEFADGSGAVATKDIPLLELTTDSDAQAVALRLVENEPLIPRAKLPQVIHLVQSAPPPPPDVRRRRR